MGKKATGAGEFRCARAAGPLEVVADVVGGHAAHYGFDAVAVAVVDKGGAGRAAYGRQAVFGDTMAVLHLLFLRPVIGAFQLPLAFQALRLYHEQPLVHVIMSNINQTIIINAQADPQITIESFRFNSGLIGCSDNLACRISRKKDANTYSQTNNESIAMVVMIQSHILIVCLPFFHAYEMIVLPQVGY